MASHVALLTLSALLCFCRAAGATQLIINGGFETGNFAGWTLANLAGSAPGSSFFVTGARTAPLSGEPIVAPATGSFAAVSDQGGPGTHALIQSFTIPAGSSSDVLSFSLFANSRGRVFVNPVGLDHTDGPNQQARVDLLTASAGAFDTGAGVIRNFYLGADGGSNPHRYTNYTFDITSLVRAGGTFQIRFAETDNQDFFNLGIDNISVDSQAAAVPEPGNFAGVVVMGIALAGMRVRRLQR